MGTRTRSLALTVAVISVIVVWPAAANAKQVCWPAIDVPAVHLPALTLPGKEIPAKELPLPAIPGVCVGDICRKGPPMPIVTIPAVTIPAVTIPAVTIPGYTLPERCFESDKTEVPSPPETTVRVHNYQRIDSQFSLALSIAYWRQTGNSSSVPNPDARGFGEVNAAGFVKNQYVRSYLRRDGTFVPGHWRHGKGDGRPTCKIIRC